MSNNFTSGMAGPAAVEMLNLLWDRVTEQIVGNSTTSLTIGSGNPTTIEYYVCKLASGIYSWVAV